MVGRVIKKESNYYKILCDNKILKFPVRGKVSYKKNKLLVGDFVKIDLENEIIYDVLERKNELRRPKIANVDYGIIVTSLKSPDFSSYLLDKNLSFLIYNNITPIICFTKNDLLKDKEKDEIDNIKHYYEEIGFIVVYNYELEKIKKIIANKVVCLTGQTGAGKSSLINRLDNNLNLKTSEISKALNRGVHTTKHVEIFNVNSSLVADTPGFSSLDLKEMTKDDIKDSFVEFSKYQCIYKDCNHINESDCEIKNHINQGDILLSRYINYKKLIDEVNLK